MTELLTDAWFDAVSGALEGLPPGPGGSGVVEVVISGGDPGRLATTWVVTDGRLASVGRADGTVEPDATLPQSRADLEAIVAGDRDPAVAFMRGDLKPEGRAAAVLSWLSAMARADTRAALGG
jgi:hypothetical protein